MLDFLFSNTAVWFTIPAAVGTLFFIVKLVFVAIGFGPETHDGDPSAFDAAHVDPTDAFKLISLQTVLAFCMGFGWGGLAVLRSTDWSLHWVVIGAVAMGVAMMYLAAGVMRAVLGLHASGNINISAAHGAGGVVYVSVPASGQGQGQATLVVDGRQRTFNAVSAADALPTGTRVKVVAVNEDNTVTLRGE